MIYCFEKVLVQLKQDAGKIQMTFSPISILMVSGALSFILIMLLPALFELKKPQDAGPRKIMEEIAAGPPRIEISSMEKDVEVNQDLLRKVSAVISVLPNLEA